MVLKQPVLSPGTYNSMQMIECFQINEGTFIVFLATNTILLTKANFIDRIAGFASSTKFTSKGC